MESCCKERHEHVGCDEVESDVVKFIVGAISPVSQRYQKFNDVLATLHEVVKQFNADTRLPESNPLYIRDLHGKVRLAFNVHRNDDSAIADKLKSTLISCACHRFVADEPVLFRDDFFDPDAIFSTIPEPNYYFPGSDERIRLLERQLIGHDWLNISASVDQVPHPPRVVFFGVKGGVGRSTALTMLAHELASNGKKVLLLDLDLESPGLSGLLLPSDRLPECGMVDWFLDDGVGQGDYTLDHMVVTSPLSDLSTKGVIRVAPAMGADDDQYLAKLSRIYGDVSHEGKVERFSQRMQRLVRALEKREQPDVTLIDSRAGLHDIAAASIVGLADWALLFATDSAQTWQAYRLLFTHWQRYPNILQKLRDRLVMVQALFPQTNQREREQRFLDHAYELFLDIIYEQSEPGNEDPDIFNFDRNDQSAPHYPLRIDWDQRFQEMDYSALQNGLISDDQIRAAYGKLFSRINGDLRDDEILESIIQDFES